MSHQFQLLFIECDYPRSFMIWIGLHGVLFLGLFSDFYKTKYTSTNHKTKQNNTNNGTCMPVLDDNEYKIQQNGNSIYTTTIYKKGYNNSYTNGTNNGYAANNNTEKKLA